MKCCPKLPRNVETICRYVRTSPVESGMMHRPRGSSSGMAWNSDDVDVIFLSKRLPPKIMINDLTGSLLYPSPLHTPTTTNNKIHHQLVRFWFGQSLVVIGRLVDRFVFLCDLYLVPNHLALPSERLRLGTILCPPKWHQGMCVWIVFCFRGGQQNL
jgi:hypothetical protein